MTLEDSAGETYQRRKDMGLPFYFTVAVGLFFGVNLLYAKGCRLSDFYRTIPVSGTGIKVEHREPVLEKRERGTKDEYEKKDTFHLPL